MRTNGRAAAIATAVFAPDWRAWWLRGRPRRATPAGDRRRDRQYGGRPLERLRRWQKGSYCSSIRSQTSADRLARAELRRARRAGTHGSPSSPSQGAAPERARKREAAAVQPPRLWLAE